MRLNLLAICSKTDLECKNQGNMSFQGGRSAEKIQEKIQALGSPEIFNWWAG